MDASMIHPQKLIPIDFHLRKKHAKNILKDFSHINERRSLEKEGAQKVWRKTDFPLLPLSVKLTDIWSL